MGMFRSNNRGFRNQELSTAPRARARLDNARAALLEQGLRGKGPSSFIGGQYVEGGDVAGMREASAARDAYNLDYQARAKAQAPKTFGGAALLQPESAQLVGGGGGGGGGGEPVVDASEPGFGGPLQALGNDANPAIGAYNDIINTPSKKGIQDLFAESGYGGNKSGFRKFSRTYGNPSDSSGSGSSLSSVFGDGNGSGYKPMRQRGPQGLTDSPYDEGFRNGGCVTDKPKRVNQPGYQGGGKVRMPPDPRSPEEIMAQEAIQQELANQNDPGYWRSIGDERQALRVEQQIDAQMREGAARHANPRYPDDAQAQGMRGYAMGGQIGDPMQDDGRDTVDVGVREGEYLVAPEGVEVIGDMVGGEAETPYDNGIAFLDQANQAGTGEEPGPVPINEAGEEVGNVKPGFNQGGFVDDMGNLVDPRQMNAQQRAYYATPQGLAAMEGNTRGTTHAVAQSQQALRNAEGLRMGPPMSDRMRWERAGADFGTRVKPAIQTGVTKAKNYIKGGAGTTLLGAGETARQLGDRQKNQYYNDPNVGVGEKTLQLGSDVIDSGLRIIPAGVGGAFGAAAGFGTPGSIALGTLGGVGGYMLGDALWEGDNEALRQYRLDNPVGVQTEEEQAAAPLGAYGRAFGEGDVALPQNGLRSAAEAVAPGGMNVVQRTGGGPDGSEVIVREDINGVPTFTNLRQGGFDGSTRNLQREADARAAQDVGIRQMQAQAVKQMRDNAPIYDQAGIDNRRAQELALQQTAIEASGRRGTTSKVDKLREKVAGHFTQQGTDEDGNLKPGVEDEAASRTFIDAMSQLIDPSTGRPMTEVMDGMTQGELAPFLKEFDRTYRNTLMAQSAARTQGLPTDAGLRAGVDELRMDPSGREVLWRDAWPFGDEATWGEWWEGLGNDEPALNRYVQDPRTPELAIPASRVTRNGLDAESMRALGLLK